MREQRGAFEACRYIRRGVMKDIRQKAIMKRITDGGFGEGTKGGKREGEMVGRRKKDHRLIKK